MEECDVELIERMSPELAGRDSLRNGEMFMADDVEDEQSVVLVSCDRYSLADQVDESIESNSAYISSARTSVSPSSERRLEKQS